jgi:quinol monooxygenase YgiN
MIEISTNRFMIISGQISAHKIKEFEQTFRLAFSTLSDECIKRSLSVDTNKDGYYYFFSIWTSEIAMKTFKDSMEFQLMNGAFHALGAVNHTLCGSVTDFKNY